MHTFDGTKFQDFVASHGYGDATPEGLAFGEQLIAKGDGYAEAAAEVVACGFTSPDSDEEE